MPAGTRASVSLPSEPAALSQRHLIKAAPQESSQTISRQPSWTSYSKCEFRSKVRDGTFVSFLDIDNSVDMTRAEARQFDRDAVPTVQEWCQWIRWVTRELVQDVSLWSFIGIESTDF